MHGTSDDLLAAHTFGVDQVLERMSAGRQLQLRAPYNDWYAMIIK